MRYRSEMQKKKGLRASMTAEAAGVMAVVLTTTYGADGGRQ